VKLLLINPNVTEAMTDSMAAEARRFASSGTEIVARPAAKPAKGLAPEQTRCITGEAC
jgi:allantoin racemase